MAEWEKWNGTRCVFARKEEWHGILSDGRSRNGGWPAEYNRTACDSIENTSVFVFTRAARVCLDGRVERDSSWVDE